MDFFRRQEEARSLSRVLVGMFALAVLAVTVAVDFVILSVVASWNVGQPMLVSGAWMALHPGLPIFWTLCVLAVIGGASVYKTALLSGGGGVVARALGAERVAADTTDPDRKRLLNVVEEMAIAAGLPMPEVYVLSGESGINAFAAGHASADAAITVTAGCLRMLDRPELQGVIAHEFSHIVNGDMRLGVRLMGLLFGLIVVAAIARGLLRLVPRGRRGGSAIAALMLAAALVYVLGYIGLFFGRLIQAAVARRREALADAAAVQFTRDPSGLRGALVKIGAGAGSRLIDADADEVAHMLFAPGMPRLFATHPPLLERIRALDPHFDPQEFRRVQPELAARRRGPAPPAAPVPAIPLAAAAPLGSLLLAGLSASPAAVSALVGNPGTAHMELAQSIRASLPAEMVAAAARSEEAVGLIFALTIECEAPQQGQELNYLERQLGARARAAVERWLPATGALNAVQRQPAMLRLLPTLRQLPLAERQQLLLCLNGLSQLDGRRSLSQYALRRLAQVHLRDGLAPPPRAGVATLPALRAEAIVLLAVLAQQGNTDGARAAHAYASGLASILPEADQRYAPPTDWPQQLDVALNRLDRLVPSAKQQLIEAMVRTIGDDGMLSLHEVELLRSICASLHCPLPPLMAASSTG